MKEKIQEQNTMPERNFHPLVSIVIPVYNGSNYMREAIDSALNQSYDNIEVIVVNDGSTDNGATEAIALEYGDRIRYIAKENGGVATALNEGIKAMKGDYFSWLSHDDWISSEKIKNLINSLGDFNKDTDVLSNYVNFSELDKKYYKSDYSSPKRLSLFDVIRNLYCPNFNIETFLINKKIFKSTGLFDSTCKTTQDYDFIFRMICNGINFIYIDNEDTFRRIHPEQGTGVSNISLHIYELNILYNLYTKLFQDDYLNFTTDELKELARALEDRGLLDPSRRIHALRSYKIFSQKKNKTPIWLYWENKKGTQLPRLIEKCWKSIFNYCSEDFEIIILDENTIRLFIKEFNPIVWKFEQIAHRADYFRFLLLETYGGIWLDSDTLVLRDLSEISDKISTYSFLCVGYTKNKKFFPIISFLAGQKNNIYCKKMIENYHNFFEEKLKYNIQPEWDEISGTYLAGLIENNKRDSLYIYDVQKFYPIATWCTPQDLFLPITFEDKKKVQEALCQGVSFSVVKDVFNFYDNQYIYNKNNIAITYIMKCSQDRNFLKDKTTYHTYIKYIIICFRRVYFVDNLCTYIKTKKYLKKYYETIKNYIYKI